MNHAMKRKIESGTCIDVSKFTREGDDYIIPKGVYNSDTDWCNAETEQWIWSIGRRVSDGVVIASHSTKFYQNPDFVCLFLR